VYADPPYDSLHRESKNFNWENQVRLAKWLSNHTGPVIASNQATDRIIELYKEFEIIFVEGPRRMCSRIIEGACDASTHEILAIRNMK